MESHAVLAGEHIDTLERIVRAEARRFAGGPDSARFDDLCQSGWVALLLAEKRFDGNRGVPFRHFARPRIRGAMLDELRKDPGEARLAHVDIGVLEAVTDESVATDGVDLKTDVRIALGRLTQRQQELVTDMCRAGRLATVARREGRPRRRIQREFWAALRTLRESLGDYEPPGTQVLASASASAGRAPARHRRAPVTVQSRA